MKNKMQEKGQLIDLFMYLAFCLGEHYGNIYKQAGLDNVVDFKDIAFANSCGAQWRFKGNMSDLPELFKAKSAGQNKLRIAELNRIAEEFEKAKEIARKVIVREGSIRDE